MVISHFSRGLYHCFLSRLGFDDSNIFVPMSPRSVQKPSISPYHRPNSDQNGNPSIHAAPQPPPTTPTLSQPDTPTPPSPRNASPINVERRRPTGKPSGRQQSNPMSEPTAELDPCGLPEAVPVQGSQEGCCHSKWRAGAMQGAAGSATVASLYEVRMWANFSSTHILNITHMNYIC